MKTDTNQKRKTRHQNKDGCSVACLGAVIVGVRGSPFMFPKMPVDDTHRCTHTQVQLKRGYIKWVSDVDDSLDVGTWVWVMYAGRWGGRGRGDPSQAGVS